MSMALEALPQDVTEIRIVTDSNVRRMNKAKEIFMKALHMTEVVIAAAAGTATAVLVSAMDTEPLPAWLIPAMLISAAVTAVFGKLASDWMNWDRWEDLRE